MKIIDVELIPYNVRRRYATQIAQEGGPPRPNCPATLQPDFSIDAATR